MVYTLEELAQFCRLSAAGRLLRNRCEKPAWQSVKIKSAVTRKPRPRFPNGPFDPDGLCHPRRTRLSALRPIRWPAVVPPRQVEQAGRSYARASATSLRAIFVLDFYRSQVSDMEADDQMPETMERPSSAVS